MSEQTTQLVAGGKGLIVYMMPGKLQSPEFNVRNCDVVNASMQMIPNREHLRVA